MQNPQTKQHDSSERTVYFQPAQNRHAEISDSGHQINATWNSTRVILALDLYKFCLYYVSQEIKI